jgi:AraC-like DNA-binding protein
MVHNFDKPSTLPVALARAAVAAREGTALRAADLARAAGVSIRTVYRASHRHLGGPPMARLRLTRLQQVRRRLLAPAPGETVTSAAMEWGFFHLGRFSALYRHQFGEPPSETLRRARALKQAVWTRARRPGPGLEPSSTSESAPAA